MTESKWIWYRGDYEIFHSILLHERRQEYGADLPSMWGLSNVYPRVTFYRDFTFAKDGWVELITNGHGNYSVDGKRYAMGTRVAVSAGPHHFEAQVTKSRGLPAIFALSDQLITDAAWQCTPGTPYGVELSQAGDEPAYTHPTDDVEVFPFVYTDMEPVSSEKTDEGTLYDFGKELFGPLEIDADPADRLTIVYGESREEACAYGFGDARDALVYDVCTGRSHYSLPSRAFRYIGVRGGGVHAIRARLELVEETVKASFSCDRPEVEKLFAVCAYTFHLNSREFLLDGIKRDRWCWSGDAYQSYLVNDYLFADRALNRRTITALYGKPPVFTHTNYINDYSALLIIGTYEYYFTTGDEGFIRFLYPRIRALYDFIVSRLREDGFSVGRPGDWVFIDWSDIDKTGAPCAEQILLWQVYNAMDALSRAVGIRDDDFRRRADALRAAVLEKFWDSEKQAFIDSYESGRRNVTRHANIFAILYDFVDAQTAETLVHTVLENDAITKITTPYFELYELMALCKTGHIEYAQSMIDSYWGGMLRLGATTIWEQYDPTQSGEEHYGMYGMRFGKSLCHAWGSGPVFLLGRYCAGVRPTSVGTATFAVEPNPGAYTRFHAVVPVEGGSVTVDYADGACTVTATRAGGTLTFHGKSYALPAGTPVTAR